MRAVALHPDVLLVTSALMALNCVIVRAGEGAAGETFVIDSPVLPEELESLPALLAQAGFPAPSGLLATHGDWDHLLGRLAFADLPLGCAQSTCSRLQDHPGEAQRELRAFDEDLYVVQRPRRLALGSLQALPVPGRLDIAERELELHEARGHTSDGMALRIPWAGILVAGDYLSRIEIPSLGRGSSIEDYLATLERLRPVVAGAAQVVPGHGPVSDGEGALAVLEEDVVYLRELRERGRGATLPRGRRGPLQKRLHEDNARVLGIAAGA